MRTGNHNQWATWREIHAQPAIWQDWGQNFDPLPVRNWIAEVEYDEIWLMGAGSSAYIGDMIAEALGQPHIRAIATTDLVSRPQHYLKNRRPLVINFGRSGNSAESIGVLDALDALAPQAARINITCNAKGALATRPSPGPCHIISLPDDTHDAGFAMTSSLTTMYYTALAILKPIEDFSNIMKQAADALTSLLPVFEERAGEIAPRAVYIGTGPLAYAARECALKVLELTAGQTTTLWDSTLGFRHGPKAFINDETDITLFLTDDTPQRLYETDLQEEIKNQFPKTRITTIGPSGDIHFVSDLDTSWLVPILIASSQIKGVLWSEALGLNVDDPFEGQSTLSRVVEKVKLYKVKT